MQTNVRGDGEVHEFSAARECIVCSAPVGVVSNSCGASRVMNVSEMLS